MPPIAMFRYTAKSHNSNQANRFRGRHKHTAIRSISDANITVCRLEKQPFARALLPPFFTKRILTHFLTTFYVTLAVTSNTDDIV